MRILGISCFYHDSAVALVENNKIKFAIQEERLSRIKHDSKFPVMAINKALEFGNIKINEIDYIIFYENPNLKLNRLFDQIIRDWPKSWKLYKKFFPIFFRYKFPVEEIIKKTLGYKGQVGISEHHFSHAASVFFTSPFERSLVFTVDGVGEYETTVVWLGEGNQLKKIALINFPDSLGLFYSVFTQFLGFEVNEGEYKVMGLAPYGKPDYMKKLLNEVIYLFEDSSFKLNNKYFNFSNPYQHFTNRLEKLLGCRKRKAGEIITDQHKDIAASVQKILEMATLNIFKYFINKYKIKNICMAGGVALNCVNNANLVKKLDVKLYVHPASSDAGGALGAAVGHAMKYANKTPYRFCFNPYLGIKYSDKFIGMVLNLNNIKYKRYNNPYKKIAEELSKGKIVAILHGRDEWGPRALGNRSILADPRDPKMKDHLNSKIKFREEFRPFAPVIMEEYFEEYFKPLNMKNSPYMLFTLKCLKPEKIPSAVHIDGSSRVQTVTEKQNSYLYNILNEFFKITGVPVLINTSFNLKGEPIVSSPNDALNTFYNSGIDILAIENYLIDKKVN